MDTSKTAAFELGEGEEACLLIHGFTGSPWEVRPLGEHLAAHGYFVKAIRLPGHGGSPEALEPVTRLDWIAACEEGLMSLSRYGRVNVAGLSMGGLLSLLLAAKFPNRVKGLALMAPAMAFQRRALRWLKVMKAIEFLPLFKPQIEKAASDIEDPLERAAAPRLSHFPAARLLDLHHLQDQARAVLSFVEAPTLVLMSEREHVVSLEGGEDIVRGLTRAPSARLVKVEKGFHIMPRDLGKAVVLSEILSFFKTL